MRMANGLARAEKYSAEEVIEQIREVAELMSAGQWQLGATERDLAARWGISVSSIRNRASEARRLICHAYGNTDDLRGMVLAQLDGIAGETRKKEPRTAVSALLGIAAITGLVVSPRSDARQDRAVSKLSPQARLEEITRIEAQLADARAQALLEMNTVDVVPDPGDGTPDSSV